MAIRFKPMPVLTLFSVLAIAFLLWLGNWQWGRYQEKLRLAATPPDLVTLAQAAPLPQAVQLVHGVTDGVSGWRVFVPAQSGDATVFLDTAFLPGAQPPDWRTIDPKAILTQRSDVSGIRAYPRTPSGFVPPGDATRRIWYWVDLTGMARAAGLERAEPYYVALSHRDAAGRTVPNPFALAQRKGLPPQQHLGYAITWWGLAVALIGVYLAFHLRQGRLTLR